MAEQIIADLSVLFMILTQRVGVGYILERGARPVWSGRGHANCSNPMNGNNVLQIYLM